MRRALALVAGVVIMVVGIAVAGYAQEVPPTQSPATSAPPARRAAAVDDRWSGVYVSATIGFWPRTADLGSSTEIVQQVSGVTVGGSIINVPKTTALIPATSPSGWPFLGSFIGGYARQYGSIVVGGEGGIDYAFGSISNTSATTLPATPLTPAVPLTLERRASTQFGWSVRGRLGYVWNDVLVYGVLGTSMASLKLEAVDTWSSPGGTGTGNVVNLGPLGPYVTTASDTQHKMGFTWGFGGEKAFGDALSVGGELRYTSFPTVNFGLSNPTVAINGPLPATGTNAQAFPGPMTLKINDIRLGVRATWRLNFGR